MTYKVPVKDTTEVASDGEYELIPDDEIVIVANTNLEGPFPGRTQADGKESGEWFKLTMTVRGGDYDGFALSYLTDVKVTTRNKSGRLFEAFLGANLADLEEVDWDELIDRKARALIGHRDGNQGGTFNTIKQFIRLKTRGQTNSKPEIDKLLDGDDIPF